MDLNMDFGNEDERIITNRIVEEYDNFEVTYEFDEKDNSTVYFNIVETKNKVRTEVTTGYIDDGGMTLEEVDIQFKNNHDMMTYSFVLNTIFVAAFDIKKGKTK